MTTYEVLCCFASGNWFNYLNPLSDTYTYMPGNIPRNLPETVTDSYLGRLVTLAQLVNHSWPCVTAETLDTYVQTLQLFAPAGILWARPWSSRTITKVRAFLEYRLPAECIESMIEVFKLELWTSEGTQTDFNALRFLGALKSVSTSEFAPVQAWFRLHPDALSEESRYRKEDVNV